MVTLLISKAFYWFAYCFLQLFTVQKIPFVNNRDFLKKDFILSDFSICGLAEDTIMIYLLHMYLKSELNHDD